MAYRATCLFQQDVRVNADNGELGITEMVRTVIKYSLVDEPKVAGWGDNELLCHERKSRRSGGLEQASDRRTATQQQRCCRT